MIIKSAKELTVYQKSYALAMKIFDLDCGYISQAQHKELTDLNSEIGRMLGKMIQQPAPFLISTKS